MPPIGWRLRVRDVSTLAHPDGTTDVLVLSSVPGVGQAVIIHPPDGDGASIDPLSGRPVTAVYRITVADAVPNASPPGRIGAGSGGVVTAQLSDVQGRQQLLSRRAYVEQSNDGGGTWAVLIAGFVNRIRLVSAVAYEFTIGEALRVEQATTVFAQSVPGLDNVSCLIGGPIAAGRALFGTTGTLTASFLWGPMKDYGGILCTVVAVDVGNQAMKIRLDRGWWRVDGAAWHFNISSIPPYGLSVANDSIYSLQGYAAKQPGGVVSASIGMTLGFPLTAVSLTIWLAKSGKVVACGAYPQYVNLQPTKGPDFTNTPILINPKDRTILVDWHDFYVKDATGHNTVTPLAGIGTGGAVTMPGVGDQLFLQAQPVDIGSSNPLHWQGHPMDLMTTLMQQARIKYNAASVATCRAAIGADAALVLRITTPMLIEDAFEKLVGGPFGVAKRINAAGEREFVMVRQPPQVIPSVTWTDTDTADQGTGSSDSGIFDLDEQTITQKVTVQGERYFVWTPQVSGARALDDIVVASVSRSVVNGDFAAFGASEQVYHFPGNVINSSYTDGDPQQFAQAQAQDIFERYGRGSVRGTVFILLPSPQRNVGDLVVWNGARNPNAATRVRGGPRLCMAIKKTTHQGLNEYLLEDLGPVEQPATLAPTFTLALDVGDTMHVVDAQITNVAALQTLYGRGTVTAQYAQGAASPVPGVDGMVAAAIPIQDLSNGIIVLPRLSAGTSVWIRMNAKPTGHLPSLWTAWKSILTTPLAAISQLVATPQVNGVCQLTWTNPDTFSPIELSLSQPGGFTNSFLGTIQVNPSSLTLTVGKSSQLGISAVDQSGNTFFPTPAVTWSSSAPGVVSVGPATGIVVGVAAGTATITAVATGTSISSTSTVTVTGTASGAASSIVLAPLAQTVAVGNTLVFTNNVRDASNISLAPQPITFFSSSAPTIGTITNPGTNGGSAVFTAVAPGTTTVLTSVSGAGGITASTTVTVTATGAPPPPPVFANIAASAAARGFLLGFSVNQFTQQNPLANGGEGFQYANLWGLMALGGIAIAENYGSDNHVGVSATSATNVVFNFTSTSGNPGGLDALVAQAMSQGTYWKNSLFGSPNATPTNPSYYDTYVNSKATCIQMIQTVVTTYVNRYKATTLAAGTAIAGFPTKGVPVVNVWNELTHPNIASPGFRPHLFNTYLPLNNFTAGNGAIRVALDATLAADPTVLCLLNFNHVETESDLATQWTYILNIVGGLHAAGFDTTKLVVGLEQHFTDGPNGTSFGGIGGINPALQAARIISMCQTYGCQVAFTEIDFQDFLVGSFAQRDAEWAGLLTNWLNGLASAVLPFVHHMIFWQAYDPTTWLSPNNGIQQRPDKLPYRPDFYTTGWVPKPSLAALITWLNGLPLVGPGTSPTPPGVPTTVTISPSGTATFSAGQSVQFTAVVKDSHGVVMNPQPVMNWGSSDVTNVDINTLGLAKMVSSGPATIIGAVLGFSLVNATCVVTVT